MRPLKRFRSSAVCVVATISNVALAAEMPQAIQAKGEVIVLEARGVGAQIYECMADASGKLAWRFREPIAALIRDGKTIGRHYAGPTWEIEGSVIVAKVIGRAPGASASDVPWLKLVVAERRGQGPLADVSTVQRIDTNAGNLEGACDKAGVFRAEPYSAEYVFLKK